jgi:RNA polymerase sigma factor (sigma-70 family)
MDDEPSGAAERSESERAASESGIFAEGSRFVPIYWDIGRGVKDAMGKRWDRNEWWDLVHTLADEALEIFRKDPERFAMGAARRWARRAASNRILNRIRDDKHRAILELAIAQRAQAAQFDLKAIDEVIEEQERARDVHRGLGEIPPNRARALKARFFDELTYREAAAEAETTERAERRAVEKGLRDLAPVLHKWDPRASRDATNRGDHA